MMTRLIIFARLPEQSNMRCYFAIAQKGFEIECPLSSLDAVAQTNTLMRHHSFDWSVGDAGKSCSLMECSPSSLVTLNQIDRLPAHFDINGKRQSVSWQLFPQASRTLTDSDDRRYLQLAVQFIAAGTIVPDDVLAAPNDAELQELIDQNSKDN